MVKTRKATAGTAAGGSAGIKDDGQDKGPSGGVGVLRADVGEHGSRGESVPSRVTRSVVSGNTSTTPSAASVARRKRIEYEAAQARARIEYEAAQVRARIEIDLINKKLDADIAQEEADEEAALVSDNFGTPNVNEWIENSHRADEQYIGSDFGQRRTDGRDAGCNPPPTVASPPSPPLPPRCQDGCVNNTNGMEMLARTLKDLVTSQQGGNNERLIGRLSTPRDLPQFSGDVLDWLHFKGCFLSSTEMAKYTDAENQWRLRSCLRGAAKEAVSALLLSDTTAEQIMQALQMTFGQPEMVVGKMVGQIKKLPTLPYFYHKEIAGFATKVRNYVAAMESIDQEDYVRSPEILEAVLSKLPPTLTAKWTDYGHENLQKGKAKLKTLSEFLVREAEKSTEVGMAFTTPEIKKKTEDGGSKPRSHTILVSTTNECHFCKKSPHHELPNCKKFTRTHTKVRWNYVKKRGLCYLCLTSRHARDSCKAPACDFDDCGMLHNRLLHWKKTQVKDDGDRKSNEDTEIEKETETVASATPVTTRPEILLKIIKVKLYGPGGTVEAYALLDDGSTITMIESELADSIGLNGERHSLHLRGAWEGQELQVEGEDVNMDISGTNSSLKINIRAKKVPHLKLPTQTMNLEVDKYPHLNSIKSHIKEMSLVRNIQPRILIGQDNCKLLVPKEMLCGSENEPYATLTALGWSVHGVATTTTATMTSALNLHITCETEMEESNDLRNLHDLVKKSFTLDSIGVSSCQRVNSGNARAVNILNETARRIGNRWEIGLPWKTDQPVLPDSYTRALFRLKTTEYKFKRDPKYAELYGRQMKHLFCSGYARELQQGEKNASLQWYLPHFGVQNPNKPGKLRLVYDAASRVQGRSLNDFLLTGPDYLVSILGILMRFREKPVAIMGDIKEMFLQVKVREEDQHAQRFLWRENTTDVVKKCVMTSLIFGATCSPFVAQYVKNRNAEEFREKFPEAVNSIVRDCYMDDYVHCTENENIASCMLKQVTEIYSLGGFQITGWASNSVKVLQNTPLENLTSTAVRFKEGENSAERTLGLMWYPSEDAFAFNVSLKKIPTEILSGSRRPTKREMLRVVMSVYDVHGFLSPFTVKAKILLQDVWRSGIKWDDELKDAENERWHNWLLQLSNIGQFRIPRCYDDVTPQLIRIGTVKLIELHLFCDASEKAFAAVAYWRFIKRDGSIKVSFIASKSRVAPVRPLSIPRLELQGALLASRLATTIMKEHEMTPSRRVFWTDSTTVLMWLRNDPKRYKTFVSHRLGEIDELTQVSEWRYVPSKENVADVATKENCKELKIEDVWFQGPAYLHKEESEWPNDWKSSHISEEASVENKHTVCVIDENDTNLPVPDSSRFSSWNRLLRVMARVLTFVRLCRKMNCTLTPQLLQEAEKLLIKEAQKQSFANEICTLKNKKPLHKKSRLLSLTPVLDEDGILRLGGRIDAVIGVELDVTRPVILDGRHHLTRLLVKHYHERAAHGSNEMVVNELRQRYWVINLRPTVRTVTSRCVRCRILRSVPTPPRMGDLPADRMAHHQRPFTGSGVDLFGPMEVTIGRRREKRYGVLFTCLTTRAIHIEVAHTLNTNSLIMALRRMAARRGYPKKLYSDNGTNLRGADVELKKAILGLDHLELQSEAVKRGLEWHFIPPASPHMGGAWERLIRTVKTALKVVMRERAPRDEVLRTLLTEVEDMVNSRPLTFVSVDTMSPEALTPNHFLIGRSSGAPTPGTFDDSDLCVRRQWRFSQRLADMFWKRWLREYLPLLLRRSKWAHEERSLQVGDVVIVADPNLPRSVWLKGVVVSVHPGVDGRVRVADIKTKTGILRRPAARLAYITGTEYL